MDIRNIAIIAHVDHGKTTLVDQLLRQSGTFRANQQVAERVLDSNELERERGITILAKCTSVVWNQGDVRINIVDTPGHADFGGEVERILSMVDGVLVLVDAAEGPMPQTKFVVGKALARGLKPIVVINKVDRPDARAAEVHNEIFDLFALLDASEEQLDFPTLFASGRDGWAVSDLVRAAPGPVAAVRADRRACPAAPPRSEGADADAPFAMLATTLDYDPFLGRVLTGRIHSGVARLNMPVKSLSRDGRVIEQARLTKLLAYRGIERRADRGGAGRRHHRGRRARRDDRRRHDLRPRGHRGAAVRPDRPADPGDDFLGQRLARSPGATATRSPRASSPSGSIARPRAMSRSGCARAARRIRSRSPAAANCSSAS